MSLEKVKRNTHEKKFGDQTVQFLVTFCLKNVMGAEKDCTEMLSTVFSHCGKKNQAHQGHIEKYKSQQRIMQ